MGRSKVCIKQSSREEKRKEIMEDSQEEDSQEEVFVENEERGLAIVESKEEVAPTTWESSDDDEEAIPTHENDDYDESEEEIYKKARNTARSRSFGTHLGGDNIEIHYKEIMAVRHVPTKFIDIKALKEMGIEKDVSWLLKEIGLKKFFKMVYPTYKEPTAQFLSTARLVITPVVKEGVLTFTINNVEYALTIEELCNIFGFPHDGDRSHAFPKVRPNIRRWQMIGDLDYQKGKIRGTTIRHPAYRFVHKFLATTIFCRMETGCVNTEEFQLLISPYESIELVNLGAVLAKNLVDVRRWVRKTNVKNCHIGIGGLITPILEHMGVDLSTYTPIKGTNRWTLEALRLASVIKGIDGNTKKVIYPIQPSADSHGYILLPCPQAGVLGRYGPDLRVPLSKLLTDSSLKTLTINQMEKKQRDEAEHEPPMPQAAASTSQPRKHPATNLPLLPEPLRTKNERWMFENLVHVHKENLELKRKASLHEKAISKLMKIVKKLTPKSFRKRTNKNESSHQDVGSSSKVNEGDEGYLQNFLEDYVDEDGEPLVGQQMEEDENEQQPIVASRHSIHLGEDSTPQFDAQAVAPRHSIHNIPSSSTRTNEESDDNSIDKRTGLAYKRKKVQDSNLN